MRKPMEIRETAVKYLIRLIHENEFQTTHGSVKISIPENWIEDCLEREEEQIVAAWEDGFERDFGNSGENYYLDNFGYLR